MHGVRGSLPECQSPNVQKSKSAKVQKYVLVCLCVSGKGQCQARLRKGGDEQSTDPMRSDAMPSLSNGMDWNGMAAVLG